MRWQGKIIDRKARSRGATAQHVADIYFNVEIQQPSKENTYKRQESLQDIADSYINVDLKQTDCRFLFQR